MEKGLLAAGRDEVQRQAEQGCSLKQICATRDEGWKKFTAPVFVMLMLLYAK